MTKIAKRVAEAWLAKKARSCGNTRTDGSTIWLYGRPIVTRTEGRVFVSLAGANTLTTRDRVNAIPGVSCHQERGIVYLNGKPWDGTWAEVVQERP